MTDPLVVVPARPAIRQGQTWLLLIGGVLWLAQGLTDLAVAWGFAVPRVIGFAGAAAGLVFTVISVFVHLASPETISGFARLDRSTRRAALGGNLR